ncbi:MAG TPA: chemotaxis protein CheW [Allocoleopsis sp.]
MSPTPYKRRFQKQIQNSAPVEKLIAFQLGSEQYAIPVQRVYSVMAHFTAHASLATGESLVLHNQAMVTLVDTTQLFPSQQNSSQMAIAACQYLVVCLLEGGELLGIPVPTMPTILEADLSQLETLPAMYRQGQLHPCIEQGIPGTDGSVVFYVNVERLSSHHATSSKRDKSAGDDWVRLQS